jgi:hypothetical protein
MISELGEYRNCSRLKMRIIVIQLRNETIIQLRNEIIIQLRNEIIIQLRNELWNGRPNFFAKLNFIPALC